MSRSNCQGIRRLVISPSGCYAQGYLAADDVCLEPTLFADQRSNMVGSSDNLRVRGRNIALQNRIITNPSRETRATINSSSSYRENVASINRYDLAGF